MDSIVLLPMPRKIDRTAGTFAPNPQRQFIQLDPDMCADLLVAARVIQSTAERELRCTWPIVGGRAGSGDTCVNIAITRFEHDREQYTIDVRPDHILIRASTPAMAFYAAHTLAQLLRQFPTEIPCLHIEDWPDFPVRGVMIDISRDKVPTMATLYSLVDLLVSMKINQLQLYTEHTFAYRNHKEVWAEASAM